MNGKWKAGSLRDRWYYFWMYYWIPALLLIVFSVLAVHFITAKILAKETILSVIYCDSHMEQAGEELGQKYLEAAEADPKRQEAVILTDLMLSAEDASDFATGSLARIYTEIGDGTLDILVLAEDDFARFADSGIFLDPGECCQGVPEAYLYRDSGGNAVGISTSCLPRLASWGAYPECGGVLGILSAAPHKEAVRDYLNYLMTNETEESR